MAPQARTPSPRNGYRLTNPGKVHWFPSNLFLLRIASFLYFDKEHRLPEPLSVRGSLTLFDTNYSARTNVELWQGLTCERVLANILSCSQARVILSVLLGFLGKITPELKMGGVSQLQPTCDAL